MTRTGNKAESLATPPRRWHQISSQEERWTVATWLLFVGLFAFYGGCLWFLTGWGPGWLRMVGTCFGGVLNPMPGVRMRPGSQGSASFFSLCFGTLVFIIPIALTLVPTLGTLLYIMKRANQRSAE
jgi:hypothetical protein